MVNVQQVLSVIIIMVVAPIALAIGGVIVYETTDSIDATDSRTTYTDNTNNRYFTENTNGVPTDWENVVTENRIAVLDNTGLVSVGAEHFLQDNDNGNCYWFTSFSLEEYDAIDLGTVYFAYSVSDDSGLDPDGTHVLEVVIGTATENWTVWENLSAIAADNTTWYTQENDMLSDFQTGGIGQTWYLYLTDNATTSGDADTDNVVVRWDNAYISIGGYLKGYHENAIDDVESQTSTGFQIGSLIVLVIAAVALITVFVAGFIGMRMKNSY